MSSSDPIGNLGLLLAGSPGSENIRSVRFESSPHTIVSPLRRFISHSTFSFPGRRAKNESNWILFLFKQEVHNGQNKTFVWQKQQSGRGDAM